MKIKIDNDRALERRCDHFSPPPTKLGLREVHQRSSNLLGVGGRIVLKIFSMRAVSINSDIKCS